MYIRHAGEQLLEHFSKYRYNMKNRPDNSALPKYFHESHNINKISMQPYNKIISKLELHEGIIKANGFVS